MKQINILYYLFGFLVFLVSFAHTSVVLAQKTADAKAELSVSEKIEWVIKQQPDPEKVRTELQYISPFCDHEDCKKYIFLYNDKEREDNGLLILNPVRYYTVDCRDHKEPVEKIICNKIDCVLVQTIIDDWDNRIRNCGVLTLKQLREYSSTPLLEIGKYLALEPENEEENEEKKRPTTFCHEEYTDKESSICISKSHNVIKKDPSLTAFAVQL